MRFDDIMTIAEASERFGRAASTLKQACLSGRLVEGEECRKSGGVLLVTKQGLERLYGKEHPTQTYYFAELQNAGSYRQTEKLKATSLRAAKPEARLEVDLKEGDMVTVISGAWKDTVGVITAVNEKRKTVSINVEMFGRETKVELEFTEVKKV